MSVKKGADTAEKESCGWSRDPGKGGYGHARTPAHTLYSELGIQLWLPLSFSVLFTGRASVVGGGHVTDLWFRSGG